MGLGLFLPNSLQHGCKEVCEAFDPLKGKSTVLNEQNLPVVLHLPNVVLKLPNVNSLPCQRSVTCSGDYRVPQREREDYPVELHRHHLCCSLEHRITIKSLALQNSTGPVDEKVISWVQWSRALSFVTISTKNLLSCEQKARWRTFMNLEWIQEPKAGKSTSRKLKTGKLSLTEHKLRVCQTCFRVLVFGSLLPKSPSICLRKRTASGGSCSWKFDTPKGDF